MEFFIFVINSFSKFCNVGIFLWRSFDFFCEYEVHESACHTEGYLNNICGSIILTFCIF